MASPGDNAAARLLAEFGDGLGGPAPASNSEKKTPKPDIPRLTLPDNNRDNPLKKVPPPPVANSNSPDIDFEVASSSSSLGFGISASPSASIEKVLPAAKEASSGSLGKLPAAPQPQPQPVVTAESSGVGSSVLNDLCERLNIDADKPQENAASSSKQGVQDDTASKSSKGSKDSNPDRKLPRAPALPKPRAFKHAVTRVVRICLNVIIFVMILSDII